VLAISLRMNRLFQSLLTMVFLLAPLSVSAQPEVQMFAMRMKPSPTDTKLTFILSQRTFGKIKYLPNPSRVMILFANTNLHFKINNAKLAGANVKTITAKEVYGNAQFLLNVTGKVNWTAQFNPYGEKVSFQVDIISEDTKLQKTVPAPIKEKMDPQTFASSEPKKALFIVAIDPGHGGKDTGAIGVKGQQEKTVVLAISRKLAQVINRQPGMRAVLTRNADYYIPLRKRLDLARQAKADLFVAIHADGYLNNNAKGASVYALSEHGATSEAARWLAKRENYSELGDVQLNSLKDNSTELRSVLIDLAQTATIQASLKVGSSVLSQLNKISSLHYKRVEQAPFMVLKSPDIPSILIETGFISNRAEAAQLASARYQEKLSRAIKTGIQEYVSKSY
jgi:N-acetylmuramoyl-L-alanine amidase